MKLVEQRRDLLFGEVDEPSIGPRLDAREAFAANGAGDDGRWLAGFAGQSSESIFERYERVPVDGGYRAAERAEFVFERFEWNELFGLDVRLECVAVDDGDEV